MKNEFNERYFVDYPISAKHLFDAPYETICGLIWGNSMPRTRNYPELNSAMGTNHNVCDRYAHSESSAVNWVTKEGKWEGTNLPWQLTEEQSREIALNPHMLATNCLKSNETYSKLHCKSYLGLDQANCHQCHEWCFLETRIVQSTAAIKSKGNMVHS